MTKNRKRSIALLGIMLVVFSVIAFALPFKRNGLFWLSYVFGLFSIVVQVYVAKVAFGVTDSLKSKFYGYPIKKIGTIYMLVQMMLSYIFMALSSITPIWLAIILYTILLAAGMIGFIGADAARDEIERQDVKVETSSSCMVTLRSLVYPLADCCEDADIKRALADLADEFRYSDPVSNDALLTIEGELETAVSVLQETVQNGEKAEIISACKNTSDILKERNRMCKLNKKK